jgi:hypothetical protein
VPPGGWDDDFCLNHQRWHGPDGPRGLRVGVRELLLSAATVQDADDADQLLDELVRADRDGRAGVEATTEVQGLIGSLYEHGWQPADLMHVARKRLPSNREFLLGALIDHEALGSRADQRAPEDWRSQLSAIRESQPLPHSGDSAVGWLVAAGKDVTGAWQDLIATVGMITRLPLLEQLADPPSRWPRERTPATGPSSGAQGASMRGAQGASESAPHAPAPSRSPHHPKMLARIRALLAKAESTEFPDEAEALTGKAQELMSRYAIDEALLESAASGGTRILARRVHVDSPYAATKVQLLAAVGAANRVRVIWTDALDIATVVGFPTDLDLIDMLYTSLLVQATRAMTNAGRESSSTRSVSFRRAFLLAYAQRIGERLAQADVHAAAGVQGAELVMARRSREVDAEFDRLFPSVTKMRTRRVNARGWYAGRAAADQARIAQGQLEAEG